MSNETDEHRCIFCRSHGEMTREHQMSKRVLDLAGFTLDDIHIEIDIPLEQLTPGHVAERSHSIADEFVTCVCADCNNGWMQKLDHSFAGTVRRWVAKWLTRNTTYGQLPLGSTRPDIDAVTLTPPG